MSLEQRPITDAEITAFRTALGLGFGFDHEPKGDDRFRSLMPLDRTVAVLDGDDMVATLGDFPLVLTVPGGGQLSMSGTTMVTVRPTHTRRGILRSMIRQHLDNARDRGDAIAGLWASEAGIYERFGFGLSIECHIAKMVARHLVLPPVPDDLEVTMIDPAQVPDLVVPFWSRIATSRAGFVERNEARWQDIVNDPEFTRGGSSASRHIIARRGGEVVGYLEYRQQPKWQDMLNDGTIEISTMFAADDAAHMALWSFVTNVDLFHNVNFWNAPVDDTLAYQANEARVVQRTMCDGLYVRILDVIAALEARTYETDGRIVLELTDDMGYADGTYELRVSAGRAAVAETDAPADVSMAIRDLGALYLGRNCVGIYAATGRINGEAQAVRRLGQLFVTTRAPWCPEMF